MAKRKISRRNIKARLAETEREALTALVADLYELAEENRAFIDARLRLTADPLAPFRERIKGALYPDPVSRQPIRLAAGRKALRDYRRAVGDPEGILDLLVYYVECGTRFTVEYGDTYEQFYSSLESVFDEAVTKLESADPEMVERFLPRLRVVVQSASRVGWGYYDYLTDRLAEAFADE